MPHNHDEEILFLGPAGRGGMRSVIDAYATVFDPFKIIFTQKEGSTAKKIMVGIASMLQFIWRLLTDRKIKVVHVHVCSGVSFFRKRAFLNVASFFGKKTVFHCHGAEFEQFYAANTDAVRATLARVDAVVALSDFWKEFFESKGCSNVIAVRNPVPPARIDRHPVGDGRVHFALVGVICDRKGCFVVVKMAEKYHSQLSGKVMIHLAGNGEGERLQRDIDRLGLSDVLSYEGWADAEKKAALLNSADVYFLPSHNEGLPISILEGMTYGLPVLSTPVGGIPSVVREGENGLLVPPADIDRMYQAIMTLASDPSLRETMGARSLEISRDYLVDNVKKELDAFYDRLLK